MSFTRIGELVLHYELRGPDRGHNLVFINSLGTDTRIWAEVASALAERWRVLLFDKRGHGLSDGIPGNQSLDNYAADLLGLFDYLNVEKATIVGLSIGGMIAQRVAATAPDRIASLVLCDTALKIGSQDFWATRMDAIRARGLAAVSDNILERWFTPAFRENRPDEFSGWRNMLARTVPEFYLGACAAIRDADLSLDANLIKARTLCLVGREDKSTPSTIVKALADAIPDSAFAEIEGSGHLPCIEQPAVLAQLIQRHLQEAGLG